MGTQRNPYEEYEGKPEFILTDGFAIEEHSDGSAAAILDRNGALYREVVPRKDFFDLLFPTVQGLLTDLAQGSSLAEQFEREWGAYLEADEEAMRSYGVLVYYPRRGHIVRFAPRYWHRLALMVRNSTLFLDSSQKMKWGDIRNVFNGVVPAIAGCSLGYHAAQAIVWDVRPERMKIAELDASDLSNMNRLPFGYEDLGRNKGLVAAERFHAIDPFMKISVFSEGVHAGNIDDFILGNPEIGEPAATVIVEETDNPDVKIFLRKKARESGKPVIMVSDVGSGAQRDVQRYDLDTTLPLALGGITDEELLAAQERYKEHPDLERFFTFAFSILGDSYTRMPEFNAIVRSILENADPPEFGGTPQLGSTAMVAGGFAGEAVARIALGYYLKERIFVDITQGAKEGGGR